MDFSRKAAFRRRKEYFQAIFAYWKLACIPMLEVRNGPQFFLRQMLLQQRIMKGVKVQKDAGSEADSTMGNPLRHGSQCANSLQEQNFPKGIKIGHHNAYGNYLDYLWR